MIHDQTVTAIPVEQFVPLCPQTQRIRPTVPEKFQFRSNKSLSGAQISVSITEVDSYLVYVASFEPLFDIIEEAYEEEQFTEKLRRIILQFERSVNINLTPIEEGEIAELSSRRINM